MNDANDDRIQAKRSDDPFEMEIEGMGRVLVTDDNFEGMVRTLPKKVALQLLREAFRRDPHPHWNQATDKWIEGYYYMIMTNDT